MDEDPDIVTLYEAIAMTRTLARWLQGFPEGASIISVDGKTVVLPSARRSGRVLDVLMNTAGMS